MPKIEINAPLLRSLLVLANVIEARDPYTGGHTWRVSQYGRRLAEQAGLSADEVFITRLGGMLHDLGKIGIPDAILRKPGRLSEEEYRLIMAHPTIGRVVLRDHPLAPLVLGSVVEHHEHFDGSGYPQSLESEQINVVARIISIVDAFDAMTSVRSFHRGISAAEAYQRLLDQRGQQFDPKLVDVFVSMGRAGKLEHILGHSAEERALATCPVCGPVIPLGQDAHGGDTIICPGCTGKLVLHALGETFELEFTGQFEPYAPPRPPDADVIDDLVDDAPGAVDV